MAAACNLIGSKANSRLFTLEDFKQSGAGIEDLLILYKATKFPAVKYCCPVWHNNITAEQKNLIESIQKRVFSIILAFLYVTHIFNCVVLMN